MPHGDSGRVWVPGDGTDSAAELPRTRVPDRRLVPTIFHEPWWLKIASEGRYREVVVSSDGVILGRLPYIVLRKYVVSKVLTMPEMTHVLGPALGQEIVDNSATRSLRQFTITQDLIAQLPPASHILFSLHRGVTNTLAFEAAGYSTSVDYTTEIEPASEAALWRQLRDKTRNVIRRASESLKVVDQVSPTQFLDFYENNLRERGKTNRLDRHICGELLAECLRRDVGRVLAAIDPVGNLQSAIFTIWDHESEYYLMSTRSADSKNGVTSLLIWIAIKHAASKGLIFNTDGVKSRSNMLLLTGFGGVLKPRLIVAKTSLLYELGQCVNRRLIR